MAGPRKSQPSQRDLWRIAVTAIAMPPSAFKVAIALHEFMDYNTLAGARPGTALLVERTQLAERTVKQALLLLREMGIAQRTHQGGWAGGVFTASEYMGVMPAPGKPWRTADAVRMQAADRRAAFDDTLAADDEYVLMSFDERRAWRQGAGTYKESF